MPRARRRYLIDLSDERWDWLFDAIRTEFPETTIRDALLELIARAASGDAEGAAVATARYRAFAQARIEASALLAETGRKLSFYAREAAGSALADLQAEMNEREEATREAGAGLRVENRGA